MFQNKCACIGVHAHWVRITFWSAQSCSHPVCVLVLFGLFRCSRSKLVIFCVGVFDLCLDLCPGLCSGLGSCFDFLCPMTSGVDCEASGGQFKIMSKQAIEVGTTTTGDMYCGVRMYTFRIFTPQMCVINEKAVLTIVHWNRLEQSFVYELGKVSLNQPF